MKRYILFLMFLLLSPFALSNPTFTGWGYGGYQFGDALNAPQSLWASNLAASIFIGMPSTMINNTIDNNYLPIIMDPIKNQKDAGNELYFITPAGIEVYDSNFAAICSYPITGESFTNFAPFDYSASYNTYLFAYSNSIGGDHNVVILNRSSSCFSIVKNINITDYKNDTRNIRGSEISPYLYLWDRTLNITRVNAVTGAETSYPFFAPDASLCTDATSPYFGSAVEVNDYNDDGYDDILIIGKYGVSNGIYIGILDTRTGSWSTKINSTSTRAATNGCYIGSGIIGSISRYILSFTFSGITEQTNVYDMGGNEKLSVNTIRSFPAIGDINRDGKNELLIMNSITGNLLDVYDNSFAIKNTVSNVQCSSTEEAHNCGYVWTGSNWLGIAGAVGLEVINLTNPTQFSKNAVFVGPLYENYSNTFWTSIDTFGAIPVAVKSSAQSDFLILGINSGMPTSVIFSSIGMAYCGNNKCEIGETIISCPGDCVITPTSAVLTSVQVNPCYQMTWLKNTTVQITAKAETLQGVAVNIYSMIDDGDCSKNDTFTSIASGSEVTINFLANCTGKGIITIKANSVSDPSFNTLIFPFDVSEFNGVSFNDAKCGITQPLTQVFPQSNTTTDLEQNFLTQSLRDFSQYTKLGMNILFFFILIFVTGAIFYFGAKYEYAPSFTGGIILLIDAFIVLIAVNLGWINVGIVITLAILGLVVIGLWITKVIHPTS